jgi:hypothetical protein
MILLSAFTVSAQVPINGEVVGTVENEAGVAQANVKVTLTYTGTVKPGAPVIGQTRTATTDRTGLFVMDQIESGVYELRAEAPFFEPVRTNLEIFTAKAKIVKIILGRRSQVSVTAEVDIEGGFRAPVISTVEFQLGTDVKEPVVNTRQGQLGGSFEPERITALPLDGRNYLDLLKLQPGVYDENGGEGFGSFNGARATAQNFTLDGTENTDADVALPSLFENGAVALDSIQEFRVIGSNASAEFGRNSGGQVSLFIKRGSHDFHGLAYEYFTSDRLNARNFFDVDPQLADRGFKPPALRHQLGANFSGPLATDRHFFFASYEGFRNREGLPRSPRVPTVDKEVNGETEAGLVGTLEREIDFAEGLDKSGFPFGSPSPLLVAIFKRAYPSDPNLIRPLIGSDGMPNSEVGIFNTTIPFINHTDSFLIRTDHQLTTGNRAHVRYALSNGDESVVGNGLPGAGAGKDFRTQNVSIVDAQIFGDNQVNEFRFGFSRNRVRFPSAQTSPAIQALAGQTLLQVFPDCFVCGDSRLTFGQLYPGIRFGSDNSSINGFPYFIFPSGTLANFGVDSLNFPQGRARNTFQFGNTFSMIKGGHTIRAGLDIRRLQQNSISGFNLRPFFLLRDLPFAFGGTLAGLDRDGIISGQQNFFFTRECGAGDGRACAAADFDGDGLPDGPIIRGLRSTEFGFFVQDNMKLTRRLTLDAGLRYEIFGRESEADGFLSRAINFRFGWFSQDGTLAPDFNLRQFGSGIGSTVRNADLNDFGPRVGMAWDPFGDGKTAIRAAYGIYYDHIHGTTIFPNQLNPPGVMGFVFSADPRNRIRVGEVPVPRTLVNGHLAVRQCQTSNGAAGFVDESGACVQKPLAVSLIDPHFRDGYVQRWNLTIQRELGKDTFIEVSYVGSKATRLPRARLMNLGPSLFDKPPLSVIYFQGADVHRPNPQFDTITVQESSASSIYHSVELQVQRRLAKGLSFQAAYSLGHSLDDVSSNGVNAGTGGSIFPQNSFDLSSERGPSAFDVRHRLVINYVYDLPFGPGRSFLSTTQGVGGKALEGWSISGITVFQTGFPVTVLAGYDVNEDGVLNDRPFLVPGHSLKQLRASGVHDKTRFFVDPTGGDHRFCDINGTVPLLQFPCSGSANILTPGRSTLNLDPTDHRIYPTLADFFRRTYFDANGNLLRPFDPNLLVGRGVFTGPGRVKFDFALRKITSLSGLREGMTVEFRADFFNIFNQTNLGDPEAIITAPQFGEITSTSTSSRHIQLALKLAF